MIERKYEKPAFSQSPILFATDSELLSSAKRVWFFDVEIYQNYLLIAFKSYDEGKVVFIESSPWRAFEKEKLYWMLTNLTLVGYNSNHFDRFIVWAALAGKWPEELKAISDAIILGGLKPNEVEQKFNFKCDHFDHIDLQQVAPAAAQQLSLKHYGARMHCKRLQDLPINPHNAITQSQSHEIKTYCVNDLDVTGCLYHKLREPIRLRSDMSLTYGTELRSSSDAQIAEKAIGTELHHRTGIHYKPPSLKSGEKFKYTNPGNLAFRSAELQGLFESILDTVFVIGPDGKVLTDSPEGPISAKNLWKCKIGTTSYTLGIGGLHSEEKKRSVYTTDEVQIFDRDVASYYPAIIMNQQLFPQHLGRDFLDVYRDIYERRLRAKKDGDKQTSESLKICINGCFGKLGSRWSIFYSPHLLVQVTLTGQLSLLMLIESMEYAGITVISANTDGIVMLCPNHYKDRYDWVIEDWERRTGFVTEETKYASVHSRDVNSYIAICPDGKIKAKGAYVNNLSMSNPDRECLMTNPTATICSEAAMLFLRSCQGPNPITIEQTIKSCKDVTKFLISRRVNGGAVRDKTNLGKVCRWYIRDGDFGAIYYKNPNAAGSTNKVPDSDGGWPMLELGEMPTDINYRWYIKRAHKILKDVGYYNSEEKQLTLF